jgi:hypothetical protein
MVAPKAGQTVCIYDEALDQRTAPPMAVLVIDSQIVKNSPSDIRGSWFQPLGVGAVTCKAEIDLPEEPRRGISEWVIVRSELDNPEDYAPLYCE